MFFTKESIKKNKGFTLIEILVSLNIMILLLSLLVMTFKAHISAYEYIANYSTTSVSIKEALMFIEQEVDRNSDEIKLENNILSLGKYDYLSKLDWGKANKISKVGTTLYYYFKNDTGGYTSQPLLYNVNSFILEENNKVFFVKIKTEDGTESEKAFFKKCL